jgi:hypothetical protein
LTEELPRPEYPRPQFRRPGWANLNGEWAFAFDDEDAGLAKGWHLVSPEDLRSEGPPFDRRITVPFCYQSELSGISDAAFHDVVWYAGPWTRALYRFLLRQFFVSPPRELEEAAVLDGANRYQIYFRVILPLSKAPLATVAVLSFLQNWNDFLWPVYVLFSPQNLTLQPGLSKLQGAYETEYPIIMAGGVLASIPVLILFIFAQRYIIEGVLAAA